MTVKTFEALDLMRFAAPNIWDLDRRATAANRDLISFLEGRGWGSYSPLWKRMPCIWRTLPTDADIASWWKTSWLVDGMKAVRDEYKGIGSWYPLDQGVRSVAGMRFRSSARGVLFTKEHGAEVHVINPRKSQTIDRQALGFLARTAFEEHVIDDPNTPAVAVLDLGSKSRSKTRTVAMHRGAAIEMMDVDRFEYVVNEFVEALKLIDMASYGGVSALKVGHFRISR